jgi:murein L,D-transpeptidase YafK
MTPNRPAIASAGLLAVLLLLALPGSAKIARTTPPVDRIVVYKHQRKLALLAGGKEIKVYRVGLGTEPVGAKRRQGDHRTPEGVYVLDARNEQSHYYKALHISYPGPQDREFAKQHGVLTGGDIMLHGTPAEFAPPRESDPPYDWTDGCIAVRNREMDEILRMVAVGTPIEIRP